MSLPTSLTKPIVQIIGTVLMCLAMALLQLGLRKMEELLLSPSTLTDYEKQISSHAVLPDTITERLSKVGGLAKVKDDIRAQILLPLQHPEIFASQLSKLPRGVLLYGIPGTGKTMLAKAIAAEAGCPFVSLSLASLESKWFGETSKLLQASFSYARKVQPCVLFFDEIDGMMRTRDSQNDSSCVYGMKTEFLNNMDGMQTRDDDKFVVIACTNNMLALDPAVKRRLPQVYKIDPPSGAEVVDILSICLEGSNLKRSVIRRIAK